MLMLLLFRIISTNYHQHLEYIISRNIDYFDNWIVVTSPKDIKTKEIVKNNSKIILIQTRFNSLGRRFNKGKGVRKGQQKAYRAFPESWYLILDSDILLSKEFEVLKANLNNLDENMLYGSMNRIDFESLSDVRSRRNGLPYLHNGEPLGFFQLYAKHIYYDNSISAALCDLTFSAKFEKRLLLEDFTCIHLGRQGDWEGKGLNGFKFD